MKKYFKKMVVKLLRWLGTTRLLSIPRAYIGRSLAYYYSIKGEMIYDFAHSLSQEDTRGIDLIKRVKEETEMLLADQEAYLIYITAKKTEKIEGDIAEVGVYRGGSTKIIREATTKRSLYVFDTFDGLPELSTEDDRRQFQKGDYSASLESVKKYLKNYSNIYFYKGKFPYTAGPIKNKIFSFVYLDVDIYESTIKSLEFFYPRMSKGGIIISHDYPSSEGVKKAFSEFFENKLEIIIEPFGTDQCLVVKI